MLWVVRLARRMLLLLIVWRMRVWRIRIRVSSGRLSSMIRLWVRCRVVSSALSGLFRFRVLSMRVLLAWIVSVCRVT